MKWIAVPVAVLGLAILAAILKRKFLKPRCPACGQRGLQTVNEIPACGSGKIHLSYHLCPRCGEKLKRYYGKWFIPKEEEWRTTAMKGPILPPAKGDEYPRPDSNGRPSV
jgi:hypothetical protein